MDRGAWQATIHRVAKSQTRLKQLSTYAPSIGRDVEQLELSLLVGKWINTTALVFGGQSVGKESVCNAGDLDLIPGSGREWLPTLVILPGEFHGQWNLAGHSPWDHKESNTTERRMTQHTHFREMCSVSPQDEHIPSLWPHMKFILTDKNVQKFYSILFEYSKIIELYILKRWHLWYVTYLDKAIIKKWTID